MIRTTLTFLFFSCILFQSCKADKGTVTKEEAAAAGLRLEAIVKSGNAEAAALFFDVPSMYEIVKKKIRNTKDLKEDFDEPLLLLAFTQQIVKIAKTGSYQLLRSYEKDGRQRLLFRTMGNGDINYHDYQLTKVNNVVKAEDVLNYMTGEDVSTTYAATTDALADVSVKDDRYADTIKLIRKMGAEGHYYNLKEVYERLPAELQRGRGLMTIYLEACRAIGGDAF